MRVVGIFLWLAAFVAAQPAAAASSPSLRSLEQQLSSLLAGKSADVGIAALDLRTGETVSIKGDEPFPMASTVKIAVAAIYLAQVEHGRRSLDDRISGQSASRLMERMIIRSDNHATDLLAARRRRAARAAGMDRGQPPQQHAGRPHHRPAAPRQARPVGRPRFLDAQGDGRAASADRQRPAAAAAPAGAICSA